MKIRDLLEELRQYNQEAEVSVVVRNRQEKFSIAYGYAEGVTKGTCATVNFCVDRLNSNENESDDDDDPSGPWDFTDFDPI